jgi:hypothetical protein
MSSSIVGISYSSQLKPQVLLGPPFFARNFAVDYQTSTACSDAEDLILLLPDDCRAALAISGDIDRVTLMLFGDGKTVRLLERLANVLYIKSNAVCRCGWSEKLCPVNSCAITQQFPCARIGRNRISHER